MTTFLQQLHESTQLMVFVVCIAAGLAYLGMSALLSQLGAGHGHDHDHDHGGDSGHTTVSIFSPKIIAIFMVGLGAGGSLATIYGRGPTASSLIGLAAGLSLGALMVVMLRALYSQQASSNMDIGSAIGKLGTVTIDIGSGGTGEIGLSVSGQYNTFLARANSNDAIPRGRMARVVSISGSTLIVEISGSNPIIENSAA
jgi:membrane protein implicated in regulation of membrane protease activity